MEGANIPFDLLRDNPQNIAALKPGMRREARNGPEPLCGTWVMHRAEVPPYGMVTVGGKMLRLHDDKVVTTSQYIRFVRLYQTRSYWLGCGCLAAGATALILILAACIKVLL